MASLIEMLTTLTQNVASRQQTLDDALSAVQSWLDANARQMTEADRNEFSQLLTAEKDPTQRNGKAEGDDTSLIASILRLHAMRLLYRFDERRQGGIPPTEDGSPYGLARRRFQMALREAEIAVNESRIDTAIANANAILGDASANHRWLQDALIRLQTCTNKDLIQMAEKLPAPDLEPLPLPQRFMFGIFGIKQEELTRRNMASLRRLADLQTAQMVELARLLADSFNTIGDHVSARQALNLLSKWDGATAAD